ncbi:MAG: NAD(P)-dependent oxidoreductase [Pseudomonadales bacterium]
MSVLVTGSAGHLGEAVVRSLRTAGVEVAGLDAKPSPFTDVVGSIVDRARVSACLDGVDTVYHTATLHKPHVETHTKQDFVDTNISGTLALLDAAVARGVARLIFTSTTSVYGDAMRPPPGQPAVWVTEDTVPRPRNIYGVTKLAAEDLCRLFHRLHGLRCIILRTSRFFPEADDDRAQRAAFSDDNIKANEFLHRRVDLEDVVSAHLLAAERAETLGFGRYIVSATTPFVADDVVELTRDAPAVVRRRVPGAMESYRQLGWSMFGRINRVYVNRRARQDLGWQPRYDFAAVVARCLEGRPPLSDLSAAIGSKGYHDRVFDDGPYPVRE